MNSSSCSCDSTGARLEKPTPISRRGMPAVPPRGKELQRHRVQLLRGGNPVLQGLLRAHRGEIVEAQLQGDGLRLPSLVEHAEDDLVAELEQHALDARPVLPVALERRFAGEGPAARLLGKDSRVPAARGGARNPAAPAPRRRESSGRGMPRSCFTEVMFSSVSRCSVFSPMPHRSFSARPSRNASAPSASTSTSPSGFPAFVASLARYLFGPIPTEIASPVLLLHFKFQPAARARRGTEEPLGPREIEERLVDGDLLDVGGVARQYSHDLP